MKRALPIILWTVNAGLYILLLDAAVETMMSGSPTRWIVAFTIAAYAGATVLLWRRTALAPKILASLVVLGVMIAYSGWKLGSLDAGSGIVVARQSGAVAGAAYLVAIFLIAAISLIFVRPLPLWLRLCAAALCAYMLLPFALALRGGSGVGAAIAGATAPLANPFWLRGAYLMVEVALPLLFLASVVAAVTAVVRRRPDFANALLGAVATLLAIQIGALEAGTLGLPTIVAFEHPQLQTPCNGATTIGMDFVAPGASTAGQMGAGSGGNQMNGIFGGSPAPETSAGSETAAPASPTCVASSENGNQEAAAPAAEGKPSPSASAVETTDLAESLSHVFDALQAYDASAPRDSYDPQAVVDQMDRDPVKLFDWVRDNTELVPYQGSLRGPVGVLMDRVGSSLDRALLLAQLEQLAGGQVRLARGRLSEGEARGILAAMKQAAPFAGASSSPADDQSSDDTTIDDWERSSKQRQEAIDAQMTMLTSLVPDSRPVDPTLENEELAAIEDHWWVQVGEDGAWSDFDPSNASAAPGKGMTAALSTTTIQQIDPKLFHDLEIRVVVERWHDDKFSENVALDYQLRPSELIGQPIVLRFVNSPNSGEQVFNEPLDQVKARALAAKEWQPVLRVGDRTISQSGFNDTGEITGNALTPPGDAQGDLTAVWLDFELKSPDTAPRVIRREVMDIRGPAARASGTPVAPAISDSARLDRGLALQGEIHVLPMVGDISQEFVLHEFTQALLTNREMLLRVTSAGPSVSQDDLTSAVNALSPLPVALYALAQERQTLSPVRGDRYLDRLNVLSSFTRPGMAQNPIETQETLDIANNEVAVRPGASDPDRVRLEQGIVDTFAEQAALPGADPGDNTADLFGASGAQGNKPIVVLRNQESTLQSLDISPDALARVKDDLAAGYAVVAPSQSVELNGKKQFGWWRVDPSSGASLGIMGTGFHQATTERGLEDTYISNGGVKPCWNIVGMTGVYGDVLRYMIGVLSWVNIYGIGKYPTRTFIDWQIKIVKYLHKC